MVKPQYGIKVPFDGVYLWVTNLPNADRLDSIEVIAYETKEEAKVAAQIWGKNARVEIYIVDN